MSRRAPHLLADERATGSHRGIAPAAPEPRDEGQRLPAGRNGPAGTALVLGLLALVAGLLSFLGTTTFVAALLGALAILLAIAGYGKARRRRVRGLVASTVGFLTGLLGIAIAVVAATGVPSFLTGGASRPPAPAAPAARFEPQPAPPALAQIAPAPGVRAPRTGPPPAAARVAPPPNWRSYGDQGFRLRYPQRWQVRRLDDTLTEFSDLATGMYLRIHKTGGPLRPPVQVLREIAPAFAATHGDYRQLAIAPTRFQGRDAARWQYSYTDGGASLRADYLTFNTQRSAFNLNFQTHRHDWRAARGLYETMLSSFRGT